MNPISRFTNRDAQSQGTSSDAPKSSQIFDDVQESDRNKPTSKEQGVATQSDSTTIESEQLKTQDVTGTDLKIANGISEPHNKDVVSEQNRLPDTKTSDDVFSGGIQRYDKGYLWNVLNVWGRSAKAGTEEERNSQVVDSISGGKEIKAQPCETQQQIEANNDNFPNDTRSIHRSVTSTKFIPDKVLIQSPTTVIVEENVSTADPENEAPATNNETETTNAETETDANFIWDITRRVSRIPFLPLKAADQLISDGFTPNKCSQVTDNGQHTISSNMNRSVSFESQRPMTEDEGRSSSWWTPWKWNFAATKPTEEAPSEISTGLIEDELLKVQRKEIANQIKCQSYGIPKSVTWGILRQEDEDYGHVYITGNGYKKPVLMKSLPTSAFELQESQLSQSVDNNKANQAKVESIVLPDIEWNYRDLTLRTRCRIAMSKIPALQNLFAPQSHLYYDSQKNKSSSKKIVKKALVICFHGFLPQKIVKNIIGEGTGSAQKMEELAIKELERWSDIHNVELDIESINLEGYGKLFERVNECLSILENWLENISRCDFILAVSNSHSVPLAIHVIARLITSGYLDRTEKLGFIGYSGVCMGPIPEVESKISIRGNVGQDADIISEILDLEDPDSLQSKELSRNMKVLIRKNFKVTFIGSLNDCFSPLYSSLGLHLLHPNIYRALYIDGSQHQPDFLTSLFNLILTVKNLNFSDHGLLIELSNFFTGQIGDGQHSKVLNNKYGYRIGINNMLNTSDLFYQQKVVEELTNIREYTTNSYHIPWCLRGFLEELEKLQKHFDAKQIIEQLYEEFKSWEPETQKMKDLRYCMLAFESVMNEDLGL